jgi:hypothetical protein
MWVYINGGGAAYNLDHVTRLFVEETGSGAALKADLAGKTLMVGYYGSKAEAQAALNDILEKREANVPVVRL